MPARLVSRSDMVSDLVRPGQTLVSTHMLVGLFHYSISASILNTLNMYSKDAVPAA